MTSRYRIKLKADIDGRKDQMRSKVRPVIGHLGRATYSKTTKFNIHAFRSRDRESC